RSGVATVGSEVSFIEQIGGARTGTVPSSQRAVACGSLPFPFQKGAAWQLNLISRLDTRREPLGLRAADSISLSSEPDPCGVRAPRIDSRFSRCAFQRSAGTGGLGSFSTSVVISLPNCHTFTNDSAEQASENL